MDRPRGLSNKKDAAAADVEREGGVLPLLFRKREYVVESPYAGKTTSCETTGKTLDYGPDD